MSDSNRPRNARHTPLHNAYAAISALRLIPHIIVFLITKQRPAIVADIRRWGAVYDFGPDDNVLWQFIWLMSLFVEFRNLFYRRTGRASRLFYFLAPPMQTLYLPAKWIGPGLFLQHGFATIVMAESVGANCWINQQVTIGFDTSGGLPILEDNVTVNAGAKIIGKVRIGANSVIGANAVVVKDVPPNCTVVGIPARIVRRDGVRVDEKL